MGMDIGGTGGHPEGVENADTPSPEPYHAQQPARAQQARDHSPMRVPLAAAASPPVLIAQESWSGGGYPPPVPTMTTSRAVVIRGRGVRVVHTDDVIDRSVSAGNTNIDPSVLFQGHLVKVTNTAAASQSDAM